MRLFVIIAGERVHMYFNLTSAMYEILIFLFYKAVVVVSKAYHHPVNIN
jgi:hypothetical protein